MLHEIHSFFNRNNSALGGFDYPLILSKFYDVITSPTTATFYANTITKYHRCRKGVFACVTGLAQYVGIPEYCAF